jgi:hypothetical protein
MQTWLGILPNLFQKNDHVFRNCKWDCPGTGIHIFFPTYLLISEEEEVSEETFSFQGKAHDKPQFRFMAKPLSASQGYAVPERADE